MTDPKEPPKPIIRTGKPGRPKGLPKTGGRKAGVPNRLNGTISDMLKRLGADPGHVLARIMMNPKTDPELRRKCAADLLPYLHPRLASTESHVTGQTETLITVISGIARLPGDPIDVTPTSPTLADGSLSTPESVTGSDTPVALPAGRPRHPTLEPSAPPSISPGRFDSKSDEAIDRERRADAKIAELNSRAAKFVA